jgi:hypothetical protein
VATKKKRTVAARVKASGPTKRRAKLAAKPTKASKRTAKRAPAAKAKSSPKTRTAAAKQATTREGRKANAIDPRIVAAIHIAIERDAAEGARAAELMTPPSAWTVAARARRATPTR